MRTSGGWGAVTPWGLLVTTFTNQPWQLLTRLQSKKDPVIPDSWRRVAPGALAPPPPYLVGGLRSIAWRVLSAALALVGGRARVCDSLSDLSSLQGILQAKAERPQQTGVPSTLLLVWLMFNRISAQTHTVTLAIKSDTVLHPHPPVPLTHEASLWVGQSEQLGKVNADSGAFPVQVRAAPPTVAMLQLTAGVQR